MLAPQQTPQHSQLSAWGSPQMTLKPQCCTEYCKTSLRSLCFKSDKDDILIKKLSGGNIVEELNIVLLNIFLDFFLNPNL